MKCFQNRKWVVETIFSERINIWKWLFYAEKLQNLDCKIVAIVAPNEYDANMLKNYKPNVIAIK